MAIANKIAELRAKIASGEIKPQQGGGNGPKVGEGEFLCMVEEASFGKGESGNLRGIAKLKVLSGGTDAEIGGLFNLYLQTSNEKYAAETIALWTQILVAASVKEDKIFDDADSISEIISNIMQLANKLAVRGVMKLVVKRKQQKELDAKGHKRFYNDIQLDETLELYSKETIESDAAIDAAIAESAAEAPKAAAAATAKAPTQKAKPW